MVLGYVMLGLGASILRGLGKSNAMCKMIVADYWHRLPPAPLGHHKD